MYKKQQYLNIYSRQYHKDHTLQYQYQQYKNQCTNLSINYLIRMWQQSIQCKWLKWFDILHKDLCMMSITRMKYLWFYLYNTHQGMLLNRFIDNKIILKRYMSLSMMHTMFRIQHRFHKVRYMDYRWLLNYNTLQGNQIHMYQYLFLKQFYQLQQVKTHQYSSFSMFQIIKDYMLDKVEYNLIQI